ncbi:MAG: hypothetical protein ACI8YQ_001325 [Polaribacter sp.]|jgi:hypothetical protein
MKNKNLRNLVLCCLMLFSLSSYIYLNSTVASEQTTAKTSIELEETNQNAKQEVMLPDVKVIKAIIEKGKHLLPAS